MGQNGGDLMVRMYDRLTALTVRRLERPGRYPDGGGLYLQVSPSGGKERDVPGGDAAPIPHPAITSPGLV